MGKTPADWWRKYPTSEWSIEFLLWKDHAILTTAQLYKLQILYHYTKPALPRKGHLLSSSSFQFLMFRSIFSMPLPPWKPALFSTQTQPLLIFTWCQQLWGQLRAAPWFATVLLHNTYKLWICVLWHTPAPGRTWKGSPQITWIVIFLNNLKF